ncbi:MAG: hypothetical protein JWP60_2072 [Ramlibacter sp.]|nr:hypothetical protein [Ramlibacter sp.]
MTCQSAIFKNRSWPAHWPLAIKQHKPVAVLLVADGGNVIELTYDLLDRKLMQMRHP